MNTIKRVYTVYGTEYFCYFYNNGYDTGVNVFCEQEEESLFRFDENINEKQIIFLLKGYHIGKKKALQQS